MYASTYSLKWRNIHKIIDFIYLPEMRFSCGALKMFVLIHEISHLFQNTKYYQMCRLSLFFLQICNKIIKDNYSHFLKLEELGEVFHGNLIHWITSNLYALKGRYRSIDYRIIFGTTTCNIWRWRNNFVFNNYDFTSYPTGFIMSRAKKFQKYSQ